MKNKVTGRMIINDVIAIGDINDDKPYMELFQKFGLQNFVKDTEAVIGMQVPYSAQAFTFTLPFMADTKRFSFQIYDDSSGSDYVYFTKLVELDDNMLTKSQLYWLLHYIQRLLYHSEIDNMKTLINKMLTNDYADVNKTYW